MNMPPPSRLEAYEILMDEEKREVLDRLGEEGLERLRDGDPTVKKDYVPPDEILRQLIHEHSPAYPLGVSSYLGRQSLDLRRRRAVAKLIAVDRQLCAAVAES